MLETSKTRLQDIERLGRIELDQNDLPHLARDVVRAIKGKKPSSSWLNLCVAEWPSVIALGAVPIVDLALYSGIPRRLDALEPPTAFYLTLALAVETDELDQLLAEAVCDKEIQLELFGEAVCDKENSHGNASDVVLIGRAFSRKKLTTTALRLRGNQHLDLADALDCAAFTSHFFDSTPAKLLDARLPWSRWTKMFFDAAPFRGARRRAARIGAASLTDSTNPVVPRFFKEATEEAFACDGFSFFAAEWLIAASHAWTRSATRQIDPLDHLLRLAGETFIKQTTCAACEKWVAKEVVQFIDTHANEFQLN